MSDERRFDDEAAGRVLRRAAELQHQSPVPAAPGDGLTKADLEQVAREAGIDPAFVGQAIAESAIESPDTRPSALLGEAKTLELVEVIEGEIGPDAIDRMLEEVQRAFADGGHITRTERSATWSASRTLASSRLSSLVVAITARDGRTEIRITEKLDSLSTALFAGLAVGGGGVGVAVSGAIGMGELGAPLVFVGGAVAAVGGFYGLARTLYSRSARKRRRELRRLLGRLVDLSIPEALEAEPGPTDPEPPPAS